MYCARCEAIEPEDVAVAKKKGRQNGDPEAVLCPHCGGELADGVPSESARRVEQLGKCGIMSGNQPLLKRDGALGQSVSGSAGQSPTHSEGSEEE
ncbi:MAG TPA: hypothetical protein VLC48_11605 [Gemmatimonadota bacterium]|nr:hypothetical protein [Gemmatimonadota bacterium]